MNMSELRTRRKATCQLFFLAPLLKDKVILVGLTLPSSGVNTVAVLF